ncbi:MAG: 16S rRNA (adenine(1518)-N(6)/adenine(1519)-N(6))-dimethyltransferase RsmA [Chloroflexota bacterium]|nr:16S rRNA (adenine(1518)-N(6)/adenine(1519)-N(6))-dimethyltransferase RsmA [Chloroflexota bacterium]
MSSHYKHPQSITRNSPRPKKSLGQHFLIDKRVLSKIIAAADLSEQDSVVEVGAGKGLLTSELAGRVGKVIAVEIDNILIPILKSKYSQMDHVDVIHEDARNIDINHIIPVNQPYKLVANLPYYAALPIIRKFLESNHPPELIVVMVQLEVAERMTATVGKMSLVSVSIQLRGIPKIITTISPRSFKPQPKVSSAVIRIDVRPKPLLELKSESEFFKVVRAGFSSPRKQIRNTLKQGLSLNGSETDLLLRESGIDPTLRPQYLSMQDWGKLYSSFQNTIGRIQI